jgi:hypothetical protein
MAWQLKPTEAAVEKLALAETDPKQRARFAPLRWGFAGNLLVIAIAGGLGLLHAICSAIWKRNFRSSNHDDS